MKKYIASLVATVALIGFAGASAAAVPQPTCTLTATPSSIPLGQTTQVTLRWVTTNANYDGVSVAGVASSQSGSMVVTVPGKATTYQLLALSNASFVAAQGQYALCLAAVSTTSNHAPN